MTTDTATTATPAAAAIAVLTGDDGRAVFAAMGLDPFTGDDGAAIAATPGGPMILAYIAADVWSWQSADRSARSAAADVDRAAADARTALVDGYRVDPRHVVGAADRFADAIRDRQSVADRVTANRRIAVDILAAVAR